MGTGPLSGATRLSGTGSANSEVSRFAVRAGHGVWTMTSDTRVVYTGIRIGMQDANIVPMQYDVSADGQRFLLNRPEPQSGPSEIRVILNWFEELRRLVPTK